MSSERQQRSADDVARLGDALYQDVVHPQLPPESRGKIVAVDVESAEFELGDTAVDAADKLLAKQPDAEIWLIRVGQSALHRIGSGSVSRQTC